MESKLYDKVRNLLYGMIKDDINAQRCLKFSDLYGTWGAVYSSYVSPAAFVIPSLVTIVMF